jgi:hypothetical protein
VIHKTACVFSNCRMTKSTIPCATSRDSPLEVLSPSSRLCVILLKETNREAWEDNDTRCHFVLNIWRSEYNLDLIWWTPAQQTRIRAAVQKLTKAMPPQPFPTAGVWRYSNRQPKEAFAKYGAAWAMQYLLYMEQEEQDAIRAGRHHDADDAIESGAIVTAMQDMGVSGKMSAWVTEETFELLLVRDLMTPIDENVRAKKRERLPFWMPALAAVDLLERLALTTDQIAASMEGMLLTGDGASE